MAVNRFYQPTIKVLYNGADKTAKMQILSVTINDYEGEQADVLEITCAANAARPRMSDELQIYINDNFLGKFYISCIKIDYRKSLTIEATSLDFDAPINRHKNRTFKGKTYAQIVKEIAKENNLESKVEFEYADEVTTLEQFDKSDLQLLSQIADDFALTFCIKNGTIILKEDSKISNRPSIDVTPDDILSLNFERVAKNVYGSCEVQWQNLSTGKSGVARYGTAEPVLKVTSHAKNAERAYKVARQRLNKQNTSEFSGRIRMVGKPIFAGSYLNLKLGDDYISQTRFLIKSLTHNISASGWTTSAEFY